LIPGITSAVSKSVTAEAFIFDAWRSGMNIDKEVATGRDKGIAMNLLVEVSRCLAGMSLMNWR